MGTLTENPALALRRAVQALRGEGAARPGSMLRWDNSGRALLVSDAPRAGMPGGDSFSREGNASGQGAGEAFAQALADFGLRAFVERSLLFIDLPESAYASLLGRDFFQPGPWRREWFSQQALLRCILARPPALSTSLPDIPLLRAAMLAAARGETAIRAFCCVLRAKDAQALRQGDTASCRAAAALLAHWLWTEQGAGLPGGTKGTGEREGMLGGLRPQSPARGRTPGALPSKGGGKDVGK